MACGSGDEPTGSDQAAEGLQEIRLALNWFPEPEFGGFYEGVVGGHYREAGFDVSILPGGPGAPTLQLLEGGRAEAAISAADDLLIKRNRGAKAIGVYPAFQNSPQGLMLHAVTGIETPKDIPEGSTVSIEVGSPFQKHLWHTYQWEGTMNAVPCGLVGTFTDESTIQQAYITSEPCIVRQKAVIRCFSSPRERWNPTAAYWPFPTHCPTGLLLS